MSKVFSKHVGDCMEYKMWLRFDANGNVNMSRGAPSLGIGERALALTASLPLSIFRTPQFSATLTVDPAPDGGPAPIAVSAVESAMREALGVDVVLRVSDEAAQLNQETHNG